MGDMVARAISADPSEQIPVARKCSTSLDEGHVHFSLTRLARAAARAISIAQ